MSEDQSYQPLKDAIEAGDLPWIAGQGGWVPLRELLELNVRN